MSRLVVLASLPSVNEVQEDVEVVLAPEHISAVNLEGGDSNHAIGDSTLGVGLQLILHLLRASGFDDGLAVESCSIQNLDQSGIIPNVLFIHPGGLVWKWSQGG